MATKGTRDRVLVLATYYLALGNLPTPQGYEDKSEDTMEEVRAEIWGLADAAGVKGPETADIWDAWIDNGEDANSLVTRLFGIP